MKAVRFHQHGGPEVLRYEDVPDPEPGRDEVLVQIKCAGINHLDIWVRKGLPGLKIPLPHTPGCDGAGIVRAVGEGVTNVAAGDRVLLNPQITCGKCEFCAQGDGSLCLNYAILGEHTTGTYCQYYAVPKHNAVKIPDDISFEVAAAAPLAYLTAWRMIVTRGRLKPSEDVLVIAAGAGVGVACVQIAKMMGARVIATASSDEKCRKIQELGADIVINHAKEDFSKRIREITNKRGVDLVVDYIGKETWQKSMLSMKRGGRLVTCGATSGYDPVEDIRHIFYRQLEIIGCTMGSDKEFFDVIRLVLRKKLVPAIDRVVPLKEAAAAHQAIQDRTVFGKVVLAVE